MLEHMRVKRLLLRGACIALCLMTTACASNVNWTRDVPAASAGTVRSTVTGVDARQRFLVTSTAGPGATAGSVLGSGDFRVCVEPSPDVFAIAASSLAGDLNLSRPQDSIAELGATLGMSRSEAASTISRTQTVNLLREIMYRNCERYLSGAIGPDEFVVQAIRDQRMAIAILAVEQLTGVQIAQAQSITAQASAIATSPDYMRAVQQLVGLQGIRTRALQDRDAKKAAAEDAKKKCDAAPATPADEKTRLCNASTAAAAAQDAAQAAFALADANYSDLRARLPALQSGAAVPPGSGSASASAGTSAQPGGEAGSNRQTLPESTADAVTDIVRMTMQQDEIGIMCVRLILAARIEEHQKNIVAQCANLLPSIFAASTILTEEQIGRLQQLQTTMTTAAERAATAAWAELQKDGAWDRAINAAKALGDPWARDFVTTFETPANRTQPAVLNLIKRHPVLYAQASTLTIQSIAAAPSTTTPQNSNQPARGQ